MSRWVFSLAVSLLTVAAMPAAAQQPAIPTVVRIVVPFAPGASTDLLARAVAPQLASRLGNTVIVENRGGASGMLGASSVARGPKDGSQILFYTTSLISAAATMRTVPVDMLNDLAPVAGIIESPLVFTVAAQSPIRTPADLVAAARARPDRTAHGTSGVGTISHIAQELFHGAAGVQMQHVPYKGTALAVNDMMAGTIDLVISTANTVGGQVKGGRARMIGVASRQRSAAFPDLPTMNTVAPGYEASVWAGTSVAAGTPPALIQRYNRELTEIARSKELADLLAADGAVPLPGSAEQFGARQRSDYATFKKLATDKSIVVD